jgi:hypothetical protein
MSDYKNSNNQDYERESQVDYERLFNSRGKNSNGPRPDYRAKRRPTGYNGMHRRRQKRWTW